jgi:acyl dehydratase
VSQIAMSRYDSIIDGRVFESASPVRVTREMILAFCEAIGETNPPYFGSQAGKALGDNGLEAPLSFGAIFGDGENIFSQYPALNTRRLLAGIDIEFLAPIRAGDSITTISRIKQVYEKTGRSGSMVFIVIGSILQKQNGEIAARVDYRYTNPL